MTRYFTMHPDNPQPRLIKQAAEALQSGEIIIYPTDSTYALGCILSNRKGVDAIRRIRGLDEKHPLTLVCHSISEASQYCSMNDERFKIFKQYAPGPYTFIVPATKNVPRLAQGLKRKVVGIRIPLHPIALALVTALGSPILTATLWLPTDEIPLCDPQEFLHKIKGEVGLVLDGGYGNDAPTTVVDLSGERPKLIREGLGDSSPFSVD